MLYSTSERRISASTISFGRIAYALTTMYSASASLNATNMSLKFGFSTRGIHKCSGVQRQLPNHPHSLGRCRVKDDTTVFLFSKRGFANNLAVQTILFRPSGYLKSDDASACRRRPERGHPTWHFTHCTRGKRRGQVCKACRRLFAAKPFGRLAQSARVDFLRHS